MLLLLVQVAAPFLCAEGITFNDAAGGFDATGLIGVPANTSAVSFTPSNLNFAVVSAGYFVTSPGSKTVAPNFTQTSGPAAIGGVIVPSADPVFDMTTIPFGRPVAGATIVPGGSAVDVTAVPEPASLWLVGIGLGILVVCNHRNRAINRVV